MNGQKTKVFIVDDVEINRIILHEILYEEYEIEQACDGIEAISMLVSMQEKPSLLLLDIMMPNIDGFGVMNFMKYDPTLSKIPIIFITAADQEIEGLRAGAADYISKPFAPEIVKLRVSHQIELFQYREKLESMVEQKANEILITRENFLDTMANLIEYRSLESGEHVKRTRELARILVTQLIKSEKHHNNLNANNPSALIKAVPLHDIGKIGIPDNILLKPGKLTPEEFDVIKTHTIIGGDVIKSLVYADTDDYLRHCYDISRHHHERWDGKGYPDRLAGEDIPLSARIVAVVDVYEALVSERCYKKAMSHESAMNIILEGSGSQFDADVVEAFSEAQEQFRQYISVKV